MPPGKNCGTHLCDGIASLDITPLVFSALRFAVVSVHVLQQSQLHKFHFEFLRLCGLQFCECASFTAVRKFYCSVAHLSSLRACFVYNENIESERLSPKERKITISKQKW